MKNVYRVMRPAWAAMERWETGMTSVAGLALGLFGWEGHTLLEALVGRMGDPAKQSALEQFIWPLTTGAITTVGCLLLLKLYKLHRVGCYPSTFLYCFDLPAESSPNGKAQVVGYCHIKPKLETGELLVEGASYLWENESLNDSSRVRFHSDHVLGRQEGDETMCHIRYTIEEADESKRYYHHGVLEFQLLTSDAELLGKNHPDAYAGYFQSLAEDNVDVQGRGYAEWCSKGRPSLTAIQSALNRQGIQLFARRRQLLKSDTLPAIWRNRSNTKSMYTNKWKHRIPTPQAVMLNEQIRPYVDSWLTKVLQLHGLDNGNISRFKSVAAAKARVEDVTAAYEKSLKDELRWEPRKQDEAVNARAKIIYDEIERFLIGDSLLDIGCGNGLISNLAVTAQRFQRDKVLLLDVERYVPIALNLDFQEYAEGEMLPISRHYDTVLLLNVLHHSADPVGLLKLAWGATEKRLIVIESVIGIEKLVPPAKYELVDKPLEDQIAFAAFVDWFYNRVLHNNVPVPYNFTTPQKWLSVFSQCGMPVAETVHLGQDIEIGPEYHILFALQKAA